jgi:hypothetical protein
LSGEIKPMYLPEHDLNQIKATLINVLVGYRAIARQVNSCLLILQSQGEGNRLADEIINEFTQQGNRDPYQGRYLDPDDEYDR